MPEKKIIDIADALHRSIEAFTSHKEEKFDDIMSNGLRPIAEATDIDRIAIYNYVYIDGERRLGQVYRWDKAGGGTVALDSELRALPNMPAIKNWIDTLSDNTCINLCQSSMRKDEKTFLSAFGIQSILLAPVFSQGVFWGAVAFQDHINERLFDEETIQWLRSAACLCANALIRMEMEVNTNEVVEKLAYREGLVETLNRAAILFLSKSEASFEDIMTEGVRLIADVLGLDRMSIWRNFEMPDGLHTSQIYRWDRGSGGTTLPTPELEDIVFEKLAPRWEEVLANNETVNGPVRLLPEVDLLQSFGVVSAFVTPVFINNGFWGFALFEDRYNERYFEYESMDIMLSAAFLCANTVIRVEMEKELAASMRAVMAASQAKGDFLSNMSHEIRTPLNAIIGMASVYVLAETAERKDYAIGRIKDASEHLLGLINDILDMSKIEANKLELSPVEFSFERMLQKVTSVIQFKVDEKKQKLHINVDKNIPDFIVGDDQRLAQVIANLLSNAVKFTPDKGIVRLSASLAGKTDGVYSLRIEVSDTGIGISPEQIQRLFSAFEQAESGISRQYGGTGLGLAISKRIVELMGGEIWVESELGEGARFIFTMNAKQGKSNTVLRPAEPPKRAAGSEFKGKRLLIAEDVEINREILILQLEGSGLEIESAVNGKEAVDMIEAAPGKYDIVFMDMQMPVMDGLEATRRIRALPDGTMPVVAMTANVFKGDIDNCLAAGMDDHFGKPIEIDKVYELLRKYL